MSKMQASVQSQALSSEQLHRLAVFNKLTAHSVRHIHAHAALAVR
jgi:hypothetical protein